MYARDEYFLSHPLGDHCSIWATVQTVEGHPWVSWKPKPTCTNHTRALWIRCGLRRMCVVGGICRTQAMSLNVNLCLSLTLNAAHRSNMTMRSQLDPTSTSFPLTTMCFEKSTYNQWHYFRRTQTKKFRWVKNTTKILTPLHITLSWMSQSLSQSD